MNKFSRLLLLSFISIAICFAALFLMSKPAQAAITDFRDDVWCQWENSGKITCTQGGSGVQGFLDDIGDVVDAISLTPNEIPVFGSDAQKSDLQRFVDAVAGGAGTQCGSGRNQCEAFFYRPEASRNNGYPVFCTDGNSTIADRGCLHMVFENVLFMYGKDENNRESPISRSAAAADTSGIFPVGWENSDAPLLDPPNNRCGITRTTNCVYEITGNTYNGPGLDTTGEIARLQEVIDAYNAEDDCETTISNPLSFILCPIREALVDAFGNVIDYLTRLLENPNLSSNNNLSSAVRSMITIANSFYILIFLVIIFSNFIAIPGLDNYTIKKTLPKLIAAIILTQFSLLICQVVLDLGNILANTLPSQLLSAFGISGTPGEAFAEVVVPSAEGNFFQNLGQFIILLLALLVGLVVGLIAFFYLVARYLFMILLVLTLPLAFAAWVLPNTEQYFKKWWAMFIRLSLMFLLISLLFAGGAIFSNLLTRNQLFGTGASGFLSQLLALIVPLVVLLLVPKTLKLSGDIIAKSKEAAQKGFQGAKDSYAGKKITKSAQEGKLAEQKGKAYEKFGQSGVLGAKRSARLEAKGAGLKAKGVKQIKEDVGELSLERQIELAKSKNKDVAAAARSAVLKRQDELLNKRVLDGKGVADLKLIGQHAQVGTGEDAKDNPIYKDPRLDQLEAGQTNPFWNGNQPTGNAGPTGSPTTLAPPTPPPGSSGSSTSSRSGGGTSSTSTPSTSSAPTPSPSPSSQSAGWRAVTPRPNPPGTTGPRVFPGTGGAVDLSDLDGRGSGPEPPEPPPGTTE